MDDYEGLWLGLCITALAAAVVLLARIVRDMQNDIELLRMTAGIPAIERTDGP